MTDALVKRLKARISDAGLDAADAMNEAAAKIEALTAENEIYRAALNEIETAPKPDHWVPQYQHCVDTAKLALAEADLFRALNTGKEVMPDDAQYNQPADTGPGDQAVAGAAQKGAEP